MSFDDNSDLELEFIQLAVGDGQRRVRTPEGAKFYGQPIGTVITAEMIRAKKLQAKARGIKPPKGGLSKKPKQVSVKSGKSSPASNFNSNPAGAAPTPGIAPAKKFQVQPPTIKGPQSFTLGNSKFSAPAGSKLIKPKKQAEMAYVVTPDGEVHAFNASGEIPVPDYLNDVLKTKFKDMKGNDPLYEVASFDSASGLVDQKPGATLLKNGKPTFTKTEAGTWFNEDLGIELMDEDLQASYEAGKFDLLTSTTVEDVDFANLTRDELESALEAMPEGKQLQFSSAVMTKEKGRWKSSLTGKSLDNSDFADIAEGNSNLSEVLNVPSGTPAEPAKAEKAKKDAEADDPLMNAEKALTPENAQKQKAQAAKVSGDEVLNAPIGTTFYHDKKGPVTKETAKRWVIENDSVAYDPADIQYSANHGYLSKEPWNSQQLADKEKFDAENTLKVGGRTVSTVAKFGENDRTEAISKDGGATPPVFELEATPENAKLFRKAMQKSLEGNPYAASVYIYDEEDYAGMRMFLSDDGKSGVALHDGNEIVSVFSDPKSKNKKVARHLISVAVENGGTRLDAFDTVLPSIYAKEGFVVKARLKWNDEYAPDGWDKETFSKFNNGEPDVVFMQHEPGMEDMDYEPGVGDYVEDYDAGLAATGGKAQDENDYRPESGDPDNDDNEVDTTPGGYVVDDATHDALAAGKKVTAIVALKNANKGLGLADAKTEIDKMISEGIAPGTKLGDGGGVLVDLPVGAKIKAGASIFTKNENGNWVSPNGGVYTVPQMINSQTNPNDTVLENPNFKEKKNRALEELNEEFADFIPQNPVPDEPVEIPEGGFAINSLDGFIPGDQIKLQTEGNVTITLKKMDDGTWEEPNYGYVFTQEDVEFDMGEGKVWIETTPEELDAIDAPEESSNSKGFKNTKQTQEAIDALEGHSGFQIKYGLKSLPDDNPLKDEDFLNETVAKAKKQYPDLPPKKALVNHLKYTLGQEPLADWEQELLEDDNVTKIQIGSRSAKNTATGITGGTFKQADIEKAIDILENFQGKAFKNELNKQGNPLGKLSPNDIVGFNKDKTITKQKFIDLLKSKIAPKEEVSEPKIVYQNAGQSYDYEISDTPETGKVVAADYEMTALVNAPEGSLVVATPTSGPDVLYRKEADGLWYPENKFLTTKNSSSVYFYNRAMQGKLLWSESSVDESEESPLSVGDKVSPEDIPGLPVGTELMTTSGTVWKKMNDGENPWQTTSKEGVAGSVSYPNSSLNNVANAGNATIQKMGVDTEGSNDYVEEMPQPEAMKPGDVITDFEDFKNFPIGTTVDYSYDGNSHEYYLKRGQDKWQNTSFTDSILGDWSFKNAVNAKKLFYADGPLTATPQGEPVNEADSALDATVDAVFSQMAELDKAVSILPPAERGKNGDGFIVVHTDKGPKITWGKYGGGGIATVATDENGVKKVLIGKRGDRDEWYLPGGAIDENESHLQGSLREFSEEVEDGQTILDNIQITNAFQAVIGKIDGTDKDWTYVTSVASLPNTFDVKAPENTEPWELTEYQWFSAEELEALDASGKLHPALGGDNLAKMVGFKSEVDDIHADILSLMNEPVNLNEDRYDISTWKKVGGSQGGSNPGGVYEDPLGNKYYVKESNGGEEPMHNEVIGGALYKAAGVNSNEVFFVTNGTQRLLATPWVENNSNKVASIINGNADPEFIKKAQADFAIDAWLDNYDVVGIGPWNLVADENGDPFRIDPGGSMMFRATGAKKDWWSSDPTAIDDMRFGSGQSSAYTYLPNIFGSMTDDDVRESAKKLLDIDEKQIAQIVYSSGLDANTKTDLYATLIVRRQKILERFGLAPEVEQVESKAHMVTPAFAKGTFVKIKGQDVTFNVELSNNEATAGLVDGKFMVYLNDELTSDTSASTDDAYAFTAGGQTFKKVEKVEIPAPDNPAAKIEGYIAQADWSSGLVSVVVGSQVFEVDKNHISKLTPSASPVLRMPEGYKTPTEGSKPLFKYQIGNSKPSLVIEHPNGQIYVYGPSGDSWPGASSQTPYFNALKKEPNSWSAWDGSNPLTTSTPATSDDDTQAPTGPVDMMGEVVALGDSVSIMKYNKGGFTKNAKIVSINAEKNTAKVIRLDENGVPIYGDNGKYVYATMSLNSLRKDKVTLSPEGTPTGISMSGGDKSSTLYGTAEPKPPVAPSVPGKAADAPVVSPEWFARAEEAYKTYRANKSLPEKALKDSSTAWQPIERAMKGDAEALQILRSKGYLDADPDLYEEIQQAIDAQKAKYAALASAHEKAVADYQKLKSAWMTANGVAAYTPLRHEQTLQMDDSTAHKWALKKFENIYNKLTQKGRQGIASQKSSSDWQTLIRKLPAILGLRREDVANAPGVTSDNMTTWDNIKEATDIAGPVGEAFRAVRTISFDRLVGPDGNQLTSSDDLKKIIGSIQKDHGAMEIVPGSVDGGGKVVDFYPVVMDLAVPPEIKGVYTGSPDFSYDEEHGMILEPGLAMYIWDAEQKPISQLGGSTRWVVKASIIPREVLPYMNNFEGDPMSHNILIPGKDTTTGIPTPVVAPDSSVPVGPPVINSVKKLSKPELEAQAIGTVMQEIRADGSIAATWTKTSSSFWTSTDGVKLNIIDLAGFDFKVTHDPDAFTAPADGKWTSQALEAAPLGTTAVDTHGTNWVKTDEGLWQNDLGESFESEELASNAMDDVWSELMNSPEPAELPLKAYKSVELDNMAVGSIVTDTDGDKWQRLGNGSWKLIIAANGSFLSVGDIRDSIQIAGYLKGFAYGD